MNTDVAVTDLPANELAKRIVVGNARIAIVAAIFFCFGVSATVWRTVHQYQSPGAFDHSQQGMCDFHNGLYFPGQALIQGESPYGPQYADQYPVARQIPFFLPSVLLLHSPLSLLPLHVAEVFYFSFTVLLILGISAMVASLLAEARSTHRIRLDHVLAIAAVTILSRGGHITLFDGYFTFELVLATFLAIHFGKRKPLVAAVALAFVASKPNYILALGFLLLFRGNVKAVIWGAVFTVIAAGVPTLWLAYNEGGGDLGAGLETLRAQIEQSQEIHRAQKDESPVYSWTRIDLLAIVAKWMGSDPREFLHLVVMGLILAPVLWLLDKRRRLGIDDGLLGMTGALILTTMLVSIYHQSYDGLLLIAPLAGIFFGVQAKTWRGKPAWVRWVAAILMLAPLYNYLSTRVVLGALGWGLEAGDFTGARIFTSINGVALAILLVLLYCFAVRESKPQTAIVVSESDRSQ
ncbi:hypothetical protein LF1_39040 [Rubripirellula obstinata]|uniref:DUF2029 domain-containing protein n=1 Tax=Rubripirellula obstinata TaxID=406547 RepID=A0A5B1CJK3_9BACT|nr:glycosyltransferase 87 family protein [Rubripirellula obstinata]KAA1261357.1 hypothetical protein LF1_39040 [Rubripirellula obstinata]